MQPEAFPLRRNVLLFYAFGFLMDAGLWVGIWVKYLLDERGFAYWAALRAGLAFSRRVPRPLQAPPPGVTNPAVNNHLNRLPPLLVLWRRAHQEDGALHGSVPALEPVAPA